MNEELMQAEAKKPYQPPLLTTISLRPEEAVLGHCKIAGQSGPGSICALIVPICSSPGS
jgi:hypothetical protein